MYKHFFKSLGKDQLRLELRVTIFVLSSHRSKKNFAVKLRLYGKDNNLLKTVLSSPMRVTSKPTNSTVKSLQQNHTEDVLQAVEQCRADLLTAINCTQNILLQEGSCSPDVFQTLMRRALNLYMHANAAKRQQMRQALTGAQWLDLSFLAHEVSQEQAPQGVSPGVIFKDSELMYIPLQ